MNKAKKKTCWKEFTLDVVEEKSLQDLLAHAIGEVKLQKKDRHKTVKCEAGKERRANII